MLEVRVEWLGGEYAARTPSGDPEWPPHPARVHYALVDAWYLGGQQATEREAIEWVENAGAPAIIAPRASHTRYDAWVHMNSLPSGQKKSGQRLRQPKAEMRRASTHVGDQPVRFVWPTEPPETTRMALSDLAARVSRLGTAASLAMMTVGSRPRLDEPAWRPTTDFGGKILRVPGPRGLTRIEATARPLPGRILPCRHAAYRYAAGRRASNVLVLGITKGHCPGAHGPALARQVRRAILSEAARMPGPIPAMLHGHAPDGGTLRAPHLAIQPLPHVGGPHATGTVIGIMMIVPPEATVDEIGRTRNAIHGWLASGGTLHGWTSAISFGEPDGRATLKMDRWMGPATTWRTVLPVELPRRVGRGGRRPWRSRDWAQAREEIERALGHAGLPEAHDLEIDNTPFTQGSPHPREVRGPHRRPLVHAIIELRHPVDGPIAIGAGRYAGYGLMEPAERLR